MPKLLIQAQLARKLGYSRARISQLVKAGIIQLKNGRIDPKEATAAIEANIDRTRRTRSESAKARKIQSQESPQMQLIPGMLNTNPQKGARSGGFNIDHETGTFSLTEARRQHEAVKMELSKLKLEMEKGNLVPKDQAIEWLSLLVSNAKARFLGLPKRMAGPLAVISNEKEIEYRLRIEIRGILEELGTALKDKKKKVTI